jgi:PAS domain S-box-containing protein
MTLATTIGEGSNEERGSGSPSPRVPATSATEAPRRVLLVDDDRLQLKLCNLRLCQAGFEVETAGSAVEAWEKIGQRRPDAIVSDVLMREKDGFAFCREVREDASLTGVPVILLSAHFCDEPDRNLARHVGASALLSRTPDFEVEIAALRKSLAEGSPPVTSRRDSSLYKDLLRANPTELARLVEQVRSAKDHYRSLFFNSANDAIALLSVEGVVIDANQRWGDLLDVPPESLVGKHIRDFAPQGHEADNTDLYTRSVGKGTSEVVVPIRRPDGGVRYMEFSSSNVDVGDEHLVLGIGRDVTDKIVAVRALAAAEEKYRTLVERIPDAIWSANEKGELTFMTANIVNILGYTAAEICGDVNGQTTHVHPEDCARTEQASRGLTEHGRSFDIEYRRLRKDGEWTWVRSRATAVYDRNGVRHSEGMITDITQTRKLEEQLRQAQKMEAIGRLAGGVAHDFNNMLNVLLGYTVMLLEDIDSSHPTHEPLTEMKRAGERSADLTRQLLAFSRQQPHTPQILGINEVVASMDKFTRRVVGEDVEVVTHLASDLPPIKADPGQIEQVIMNLVVNARDAMPHGGKLIIETSLENGEEFIVSDHAVTSGAYVLVAISDTGVGMDKETQSRIFEPFFTTKEQRTGTGLGLSIVFGIVHQYDGHIRVYSEPGKGTSFKIYLPVAGAKAQGASSLVPLAGSLRGSETILLVEDEEQVRSFVETVLKRQGYRVLVARSPLEAVRVIEGHPGTIDLLLTDVIMPHKSGRQLADELTPKFPAMKVVYMSGYTNNVVLDHGVPEGVAFLQKPVLPETLSRKVRAALDAKPTLENGKAAPT